MESFEVLSDDKVDLDNKRIKPQIFKDQGKIYRLDTNNS